MGSSQQQTYYERLEEIVRKLKDGHYGTPNNVDVDSLEEDLEEVTYA